MQALGETAVDDKSVFFSQAKRTGLIFQHNTGVFHSNLGHCWFIASGNERLSRLFFIFVKPTHGLEIISNAG